MADEPVRSEDPGLLDDPTLVAELAADLVHDAAVLAAISGGPDSTALMHLLARWGQASGRPRIVSATVDHGLRPEARAEAEAVAATARQLGLIHHILTWSPPRPGAVSQDRARRARYALLAACAEAEGATTLLTAHTLDDQAETILMRAAAGSGLSGLGGMRRIVTRGALRHLRPFLAIPKATLVATCEAQGWPYIQDPSNRDPRYARARLRTLLPRLAEEGMDAPRIARLGARLQRADEALDHVAMAALALHRRSPEGDTACIQLDFAGLAREPAEIALRTLSLAIAGTKSGAEPDRLSPPRPASIRLERLEACFAALHAAVSEARIERRTLAGRRIVLDLQGLLTLTPEPPRRRGAARVTEIAAAAPHSLGIDTMHA